MLCLVAQSCPILCDPMDGSPPGSSVHADFPGTNTGVGCYTLLQGIFPTQGSNPSLLHCRQILYHLNHQGSPRILQWVAYLFSRGIFPTQVDSLPSEPPGKPVYLFRFGFGSATDLHFTVEVWRGQELIWGNKRKNQN